MTSSVKPALSKVAFVSASFGVKALDLLSVLFCFVCLILGSILTIFAEGLEVVSISLLIVDLLIF